MSRAKGLFARSDLIYREIDKRIAADAENTKALDAWGKFDELTQRVIETLHGSDISEWDGETWKTYQKLLMMRPKVGAEIATDLRGMSVDQLKKLPNLDD